MSEDKWKCDICTASLTPFEREHDVNHQYSQCEKDGCENPKSNKKHCTRHMYID
mgnify:CR=1 FL=1